LSQTIGVALALLLTAVVAMVLQATLIGALSTAGLVRGPHTPGRATALEALLVANWPILVLLELVVGGLVAWRICRPFFQRPGRRPSNPPHLPPNAMRSTLPAGTGSPHGAS
jgi:hypothetical protein